MSRDPPLPKRHRAKCMQKTRARCTRIMLVLILMAITTCLAVSLPNPFAAPSDGHQGLPERISRNGNR